MFNLRIDFLCFDSIKQVGTNQIIKPKQDYIETNKHLRDVNSFLLNMYDELFPKGAKISKEDVKKKSLEIREAYQVFAGRKDVDISNKTSLVEYIPILQARYRNKVSANHIQHFWDQKPLGNVSKKYRHNCDIRHHR